MVATAIVFGSGAVTVPYMARAGILLNLAAIFLIILATYSFVPPPNSLVAPCSSTRAGTL